MLLGHDLKNVRRILRDQNLKQLYPIRALAYVLEGLCRKYGYFCSQASDMLKVEDFVVNDTYDGPCLEDDGKITESFIENMVVHFRNGKQIHKR